MRDHCLADLHEADFDAMIEAHIERTADGAAELPASVFVGVLFERLAADAAPITLAIHVHDDQLVITADNPGADVIVQGNEVLIGGRRLVLRLVPQHS
jgi:hypothetical protein